MGRCLSILGKTAGVMYPLLVLLVLTQWREYLGTICLWVLPVAVAVLVVGGMRKRSWSALVSAATLTVLLAVVACTDTPDFLRVYPVVVSGLFLVWFAASLFSPPSAIERFASLASREPLPKEAVAYCRNVTKVWCGFLVFNISVALLTVIYGSWEVWALYNGCISYILMGCLLLGEYLVRPFFQKQS